MRGKEIYGQRIRRNEFPPRFSPFPLEAKVEGKSGLDNPLSAGGNEVSFPPPKNKNKSGKGILLPRREEVGRRGHSVFAGGRQNDEKVTTI